MKRAHVNGMTNLRFGRAALFVILAAMLAGCTTTGNTGNTGSVRGGAGSGWENFRAEVPTVSRLS